MVEIILKCTFCLWGIMVTVCGFFPFLNQTLWCINSLYRVLAKPVSQIATAAHTQSPKGLLKFTDSALSYFAQDSSQLAWNCETGCVLDVLKTLVFGQ